MNDSLSSINDEDIISDLVKFATLKVSIDDLIESLNQIRLETKKQLDYVMLIQDQMKLPLKQ